MSQNNPKYKRLESLLSDARQVDPDPNREPEDQLSKTLKTQIPQPDVKPAAREEVLKIQPAETDEKPEAQQAEPLKAQAVTTDAKPEADGLKTQAVMLDEKPVELEPAPNAKPVGKTSFKLFQPRSHEAGETEKQETTTSVQRQPALWAAGIFTLLGVVFLVFSVYNVFILQKGHFDPSDLVLTPVTILMVAVGLTGFILIQRGRLIPGLWLIFGVAVVPPILAVLVLGNVFAVALVYILTLAFVMITWVFPRSERQKAIVAAAVAILIMVGIQLWNPAFRLRSTTLQNFAPFAIGLAVIGLVAFFIRQAAIGSIRTKLITAFVLMALLSMGIASYSSIQSMRATITENIGRNLNNLAKAKALEIGQTVEREYDLVSSLTINESVRDAAAMASRENMQSPAAIDTLDQQWRAADAADDNADPLVASVLENELSAELVHFKEKFPEHVEVFLTDRQGLNVASTNRTSDYYQGDEEWWQTAAHQGVYVGQPEYDESSKTIAINMASAIYAENGTEVVGVLRSTVDFSTLAESLISGQFGQTGKTDIYLPGDMELELEAEEDGTYHLAMEDAALDLGAFFITNQLFAELLHDAIPTIASQAPVGVLGSEMAARSISSLGWRVVARQSRAEALQSVDAQTRSNILLLLVITVIVGATAVFLARLITNPILQLKTLADRVASGDLDAEAKVTTQDEVGVLAATFNNMTSQLRNLVGSLEQRVADRTHDLELASEVGRAVTEKVADMDDMLTSAAEMIRSRFGLYYTQVYLTDPTGSQLLLRAGTGEVGEALLKRGHHLTIDYNSLNGRAALEKKPVIVADTLKSSFFKPNPLLPKTRSEMAVPLISANRILGVLDMQAEESGTLSEANLPAFEALAGQLAIAIQNARLFAETEQARAEVESQARRLTRTGWSDYLNAIQKPEQTGYIYDQNQIVPMTEAEQSIPFAAGMLSAPIEVSGESIGSFQVELEQEKRTVQTRELVQSVARQVARQVENLRLLEMAERYRVEAENITRRLTHEGWDVFQKRSNTTSGYVFDLNQVKPLSDSGTGGLQGALIHPLAVRDEIIGEIHVDDIHHNDDDGELIEAVSRQLSAHIENLRLSDLNEKRAREMETVADLSATTSTVLDPDILLQSVVDRTKESFGVYHAHIYLTDDKAKILILTAGAGETGQKMVAEAHSIAMDAEKSLVARAAREKSAVIVNDVRADPGFLPNPLLPETRSEMAVPMIIGDRVLGVFDVQADSTGYFTDEDATIFSTLASQVSVALQNARLFDETSQRNEELASLNEIISSASLSLDIHDILAKVLGEVLETLHLDAGLVSLFNTSNNRLELTSSLLLPEKMRAKFEAEGLQGTLCDFVYQNKQVLTMDDLSKDAPVNVSGALAAGYKSYIGVPLEVKGEIVGTICAFKNTTFAFQKNMVELMRTMGRQLGFAIENARLYADQNATLTKLRELDRLKSSFLANMSHELRTPLNSILGFADVMLEELDGPLTANMHNDLGLIQKNGQHLLHLINDVLDMAKIEAGRMNLNIEKFRVHEILDEATSITSGLASEKDLSLVIEPDSDRDVEITADRTRLRQVMINLVNNSIKFTDKGMISVRVSSSNEHILIRVKDTGIGIPAEKLEDVFTEFAQVDSSTTRKAGGTGLGLPISRKLVEMHGGRLWAESSGQENEGSTFYVELPLQAQLTEPVEKLEK